MLMDARELLHRYFWNFWLEIIYFTKLIKKG